ncbi:MAG: hypothetical protein JJ896_05305 [Rhodothermales bacterium]|nr:hypothetical protein [Rhodothermales bacterium]MBO6779051.1 hypothetical protein [Rhodothermales bacterium]
MELVPILSTIILVGTIATFILAVAAYVLYKIREGRARESQQQQTYMQQEPHVLVAPEGSRPAIAINQYQGQPQQAAMYQPAPGQQVQRQQLQAPPQGQNPNSLFWEYTDKGFVPVDPQEEQVQAQQQQQAQQSQQQSQQDEGYAWL